jgi:hypothetical protein
MYAARFVVSFTFYVLREHRKVANYTSLYRYSKSDSCVGLVLFFAGRGRGVAKLASLALAEMEVRPALSRTLLHM